MSTAALTVGSMIATDRGERPIEDLKPGDLIITRNLGLQKLRYISFQDVDLTSEPLQSPIKINCRHLGFDRSGYFKPNQRISLRNPMFEIMFGSSEVLVRCGDLIDQPGVEHVNNLTSVTYVSLGFLKRHLVMCNGGLIDVGPESQKPTRTCLGSEEARLAVQLLQPKETPPKRHSFPLH
jgi:hypothetical protein